VAVNGQPAKGLDAGRSRTISTRTSPTPGQAIADVTRAAIREHILEILQPDRHSGREHHADGVESLVVKPLALIGNASAHKIANKESIGWGRGIFEKGFEGLGP
jgi:hypothetical protein